MAAPATGSTDTAGVAVRPPLLVLGALAAGFAIHYLIPLPLTGETLARLPRLAIGGLLFVSGFLLAGWAALSFRRAGTNVPTWKPTLALVGAGPYRYTRNPIYLGMIFAMAGIAVAADSLWLAAAIVPVALVLRHGVIAREERYLEEKFSDDYRRYTAAVRRWI